MDLLTACQDENLFKAWFKDPATWSSWFVFLRALFALPIEADEDWRRTRGALAGRSRRRPRRRRAG
jgi:hypothetical protein